MRKIDKDTQDVPKILKSENRENALLANIEAKKFVSTNLYRTSKVVKKLELIYNSHCVYCEKSLLDSSKHIEHYRPKDIYYWLAFSWDNLLLCCSHCNSSKGTKFPIKNERACYGDEAFRDIHHLRDKYDEIEEPLTINPEKEDVTDKIVFNREAKMSSQDERVQCTIDEVCQLNRKELVEKRARVLNGFMNEINEIRLMCKSAESEVVCRNLLSSLRKRFFNEEEFYTLRHFVRNNLKTFLRST